MHDIFLAFGAEQAFFAGGGHAEADFSEFVIGDGLGADEAALEVGVYLAGCLRSLGAVLDGPGAALVFACGQE